MSNFVPLADILDNQAPQVPGIEWYARIPDVDSHRIGVDLERLQALGRLAGINTLRIGVENGEERQINVSGIGSDGSGIASSSSVRRAESHRIDNERKRRRIYGYDRPNAWAVMNVTELRERVKDSDAALNSPDAWAQQMNKSLQQSLVEISKDNYLHDPVQNVRGGLVSFVSLFSAYGHHKFGVKGVTEELVKWSTMYQGVYVGFSSLLNKIAFGHSRLTEWQASVIYGPSVDRIALTGLKAHRRKLIIAI